MTRCGPAFQETCCTGPTSAEHRRGRQHLLAGRLFDEEGQPLYATQASKQGRRYRYYTSKALVERGDGSIGSSKGWRIAAPAFEKLVVDQLQALLRDPIRLMDLLDPCAKAGARLTELIDRADALANQLTSARSGADGGLLRQLVLRIELRDGVLELVLERAMLDEQGETDSEGLHVELPVRVARRGVESRIVLARNEPHPAKPAPALLRLITRAHRWNNMLANGAASSLQDLSRQAGIDRSEIGRVLQLAHLAPDITELFRLELTARGWSARHSTGPSSARPWAGRHSQSSVHPRNDGGCRNASGDAFAVVGKRVRNIVSRGRYLLGTCPRSPEISRFGPWPLGAAGD